MDNSENIWSLPYYTGDSLKALTTACEEPRRELIQSLIMEKSATLLFAPDGIGKSVLSLQAVCQASAGHNVFDYFPVPNPLKVLWCQMERHPREMGERIHHFMSSFQPNFNNLVITNKLQDRLLEDKNDNNFLIEAVGKIIDETIGYADLVCFDPVYAMTIGDLSDPKCCALITRFSNKIKNKYNTSTLFVTHANRGVKVLNEDGTVTRKGIDLYGNRFLSAHFDGLYSIARHDDGTKWELGKDTNSALIKEFCLEYDPETWTSSISGNSIPISEKLKQVLIHWNKIKKEFTIQELMKATQASSSLVYKERSGNLKNGFIETSKSLGKKKLFTSALA